MAALMAERTRGFGFSLDPLEAEVSGEGLNGLAALDFLPRSMRATRCQPARDGSPATSWPLSARPVERRFRGPHYLPMDGRMQAPLRRSLMSLPSRQLPGSPCGD